MIPDQRDDRADSHLLPVPRTFHPGNGSCPVAANIRFDVRVPDPRVLEAARRWAAERIPGKSGPAAASSATPVTMCIAVDHDIPGGADGYRLEIGPTRIELVGASASGCYHGLQTLSQLPITSSGIRCVRILDHPDYATRGLLHDVTRGKVPRLETLKLLADRLAALKINQLQLYIEHAFAFAFDPRICDQDHGLTPGEIHELDRYCRDRFIDLVPAVATLGHMGRILSLPPYRHLAEIEPTRSWEEMTWPERARGFTLDVVNPESHRIVERIWSEILDAFTSPVVNICGDEPWDLGKGRNRERFGPSGAGPAYIDHILRTHRICGDRGRQTQAWSDVVRNHPDLFDRLPTDLTVLHWGYDDRADYEGTARFVEAGLSTFVCPGTSGWKRTINAMDLAERNIATFADAGRRHGATGLINTDWGDHGHFNMLACSWHGIALGAALGWRADHPIGHEFDRRFARTFWGTDDATGVRLLREASGIAERCETWRLLWMPLRAMGDDPSLPSESDLESSGAAAEEFRRWAGDVATADHETRRSLGELSLATWFLELLATKAAGARPRGRSYPSPRTAGSFKDAIASRFREYAAHWISRNKPAGLEDIRRALHLAAEDLA